MSDQFPPPGQPGEQPPTQMAPPAGGAPVPPYGAPGQPQQPGYPPQPQQPGYPQPGYPQQPAAPGYPGGGYPGGGYPGGGYPGGPGGPGFPAPPTGGGGKKGLLIAVVAGVVVLVLGVVAVLAFTVFNGDDDKPAAKDDTSETTDATDEPSDEPSDETDEPTDEPTDETDGADVPTDDPTITARAFLDSLLEGDCLAVEGLSTPEYFASEFTDQSGCKAVAGNLEMSNAEYTFKDPETTLDAYVVNVYGDVYAPNTGKTLESTWALDGSTGSWLVSGYTYVEK